MSETRPNWAPADDGDHWFHVVQVSSSKVKRSGVNPAYLKRHLDPADAGKPWKFEISGRLRSKAGTIGDVQVDARAAAEAFRTHNPNVDANPRHLLYSQVSDIRASGVGMNVFEDPTDDPAHGVITFADIPLADPQSGSDKLSIEPLRDLCRRVKVCDFSDLSEFARVF